MSDIGTHYDGCEQYHLECAKHALAAANSRIEALTKALMEIRDSTHRHASTMRAIAALALAPAAGADGGR
jgi:hypothetical protein